MSIRLSIQQVFSQTHLRLLQGGCLGCLVAILASGCTALHPIRGVPASYLPDQFEGPSRDNKRTIDLSLLVRTPPDQHRVAAGDVLSIYVPRVLGSRPTEVSSVGIEPPINQPAAIEDPPTIGYPITVRDDNTISLPQVPPIAVGGMTLHEVEVAIRRAYTVENQILNPDEAMVLVSLQRARIHRVLVVRQEVSSSVMSSTRPGSLNIGSRGKGTAQTVTLKAYENDVLHALAQGDGVDGLPGLNAENVIYIIRRRPRGLDCPLPSGHISPIPPKLQPSEPTPIEPTPNVPVSSHQPQRPSNRVQLIGYEQPDVVPHVTPPPFGSYRGNGETMGAHSMAHSMPSASSSTMQTGMNESSSANVVEPAQYNMVPNYSTPNHMVPNHSVPSNTVPSNTVPSNTAPQFSHPQSYHGESQPPVLPQNELSDVLPPALPPPAMNGHSWGALPPEPLPAASMPDQVDWGTMLENFDPTIDNPNVIRIPVRLAPGEQPHITEELITLHDGDIVFIESRETEVFYTAGLLGGGQYTLPRDYDLGVLEAVSIAEGRSMGGGGGSGLNRSIGGVSALNHDVSNSASRLVILRTLPNGKRISIEVDLNKAMRYQQENIRIQPGDILFLEYTLPEAVFAFTQRYLFEGALFSLAASQFTTNR